MRALNFFGCATVCLWLAASAAPCPAGDDLEKCSKGPPSEDWSAAVPGFVPIKPGEHPRLFFRNGDLPKLREKAKTPEGQALIKRLRFLLDGANGDTMIQKFGEKGRVNSDGSGQFGKAEPGTMWCISHTAGYGLLYLLTGEKKYADLGKESMDKALEGYRDPDRRYSFLAPFGALRAGPSIGWTAVGYDLCYNGWDEAYRKKVAEVFNNYNEGANENLPNLSRGCRQHPGSNHWGMQVGGAGLALMAIMGDPGVDNEKISKLLKANHECMLVNMERGFGDGGFFAEGDGTGSMSSHIAFISALQAWKQCMGRDFISPRPNAQWMALKWIFLTVPRGGNMDFPKRGAYPQNIWSRHDKSGGGYFGIGFGGVKPEQRAALLWFYNHHLKALDDKNGTVYDAASRYPHHAIMSFINWPLDIQEKNPAEVIPRCYRDTKWSFCAFRNRWQDENDIVISTLTKASHGNMGAGADGSLVVWAFGQKFNWGKVAGEVKHWQPAADGSAVMTMADGTSLAIDFSKASGAEGMLVSTDSGGGAVAEPKGKGGKGGKSGGAQLDGKKVQLGNTPLVIKFLTGKGGEPEVKVEGDKVVAGEQTIGLKDGNLVLGKMAPPWPGKP